MAELIDTHAHLDDARFAGDLADVLRRAADTGLVRVVAVATTAASSRACIDLAASHTLLAPTVGIHPNHAAETGPNDWDAVAALAERPAGAAAAPPSTEALQTFLANAETGTAFQQNAGNRGLVIRQETDQLLLFDTCDTSRQNLVLHRSYLAK